MATSTSRENSMRSSCESASRRDKPHSLPPLFRTSTPPHTLLHPILYSIHKTRFLHSLTPFHAMLKAQHTQKLHTRFLAPSPLTLHPQRQNHTPLNNPTASPHFKHCGQRTHLTALYKTPQTSPAF